MIDTEAPTAATTTLRFERHASMTPGEIRNRRREGFVELCHAKGFAREPWTPGIRRYPHVPPHTNRGWGSPRFTRALPAAAGTAPAFGFRITHGALHGAPSHEARIVFDTEAQAAAAFDEQAAALVLDGYAAGRHEPQLLGALVAAVSASAPAETIDAAAHAYATWLRRHDDVRGELMHGMLGGEDEAVVERLLAAHPHQLRPVWWKRETITADWSRGFVERAHVVCCAGPAVIRRLFRHPSMALLRELVIDDASGLHRFAPAAAVPHLTSYGLAAWGIALSRRPSTLERIVVGRNPQLVQLRPSVPGLVVI